MTSTPTSLIVKITNQLPLVEKIFLEALAIGTVLTLLSIDSSVTKFSLLGLGVIFFLMTYSPTDLPGEEGEKFGFTELLAWAIVPKVMWISSAVSAFAISFYLFDFGNDGYKKMLMIGGSTIGIGILLLTFFLISGVKHLKMVTPILLRAVPLFLVDIYIFLK